MTEIEDLERRIDELERKLMIIGMGYVHHAFMSTYSKY
jgi:hypothetical protein